MPAFPSGASAPTPPLPPDAQQGAAPTPSIMQLAGMAGAQGVQQQGQTQGMSDISASVVRMGAEIDQALKLLAQSLPPLAPWVEKTTLELRYQIGTALQSGAQPTNPQPQDNSRFPDGGGRL